MSNDMNWYQLMSIWCQWMLIDINWCQYRCQFDVKWFQLMSIRCQLMSNNSHHLKTTEKTQQKWCWVLEYIMCMQYGWYVPKKHVAGSYTPRNHSIWFLAPVFDIFWFASEISVLKLILRGRKWNPMKKLFLSRCREEIFGYRVYFL